MIHWQGGLFLLAVAASLSVDVQETTSGLQILRKALNISQTHFVLELADFDLQGVHLSNSTCSKCDKVFRNSSYLTYHWLALHAGHHEELHASIRQLCLFASCKDFPPKLDVQEKARLCNLFAEKYLTELRLPSSIESLRKRNKFCLSVLETAQPDRFQALWSILSYLVLVACFIGMCYYYPCVYERAFPQKGKRRASHKTE